MNNKEAKKKLDAICNKYIGKHEDVDTLVYVMKDVHDLLQDKVAIEDWTVSKLDRYGSTVIAISGHGDLMAIYSNHMNVIYKIETNTFMFDKLFPEDKLPPIEEAFKELLNKYTKLATKHIYDTCLFDSVEELNKLKKELEEYEKYIN